MTDKLRVWISGILVLCVFLPLCTVCSFAADEKTATDSQLEYLEDSWFNDAVFFGDSISVTLGKYNEREDIFGDALFLCEFSYSVRNAISGQVKIWYHGEEYFPEEVIPLTGKNKIFIMLGTNDIALYGGIDKTMKCWEELVSRIRKSAPEVVLFIQSCLPVSFEAGHFADRSNEKIDEYNQCLKLFCEQYHCVYVDIAQHLKDDRNALKKEFIADPIDGIHLSYAGAAVWAEQLKNPANYSVDLGSVMHD